MKKIIILLISSMLLWNIIYALEEPQETTIFVNTPVKFEADNLQTYYDDKPVEFDLNQAENDLKKLDLWIEEISNQITDLDKTFNKNDLKYAKTRQEVINVINSMIQTKNNLEKWIKKIKAYQQIVLQTAQSVWLLQKDIQDLKNYIAKFSVFLYKINNELYDKNWNIDNIKLFLKSDNDIAHTLSSTYMVESLVKKLWELMKKLDQQETKQIKRIKRSNKAKIKLKEAIALYKQQLDNLEQKRQYLSQFLKVYKQNKDKIEWTVADLFNTKKDTYQDIIDTIDQIKHWKYVTSFDVKSKLKELQNLKPYATYERCAPMTWPLLPVSKISSYFKDPSFEKKYWIPQYWIEIPAPQMTPLYATNDAIVYKINETNWLGVNWIILLHKNNTISVYLYPTKILVKEWDIVRRWQLIWYSWWEPWTIWAWFVSRQPNLTLMIYKNWKFIDPLSVLDLSVFKNKWLLPDKYHVKYLQDLYKRPRDIYKISFMTWTTLNERRVQFLDKYWVGIYKELAFWQDANMWTNIDLDLWICIWFAESTLWQHLTTANNIWNVWNNDRWDRVSFGSALAWARLIYTTLNNVHLWKYNTVIELNWYGNKNWKIYASSPYNWQNNVIKCLSAIKWYYVPDDYPFRK